jgi:hypothetical protein
VVVTTATRFDPDESRLATVVRKVDGSTMLGARSLWKVLEGAEMMVVLGHVALLTEDGAILHVFAFRTCDGTCVGTDTTKDGVQVSCGGGIVGCHGCVRATDAGKCKTGGPYIHKTIVESRVTHRPFARRKQCVTQADLQARTSDLSACTFEIAALVSQQ